MLSINIYLRSSIYHKIFSYSGTINIEQVTVMNDEDNLHEFSKTHIRLQLI